ncbi:hypothetical protein SAMN05518672_11096 [Chitinophaga sp. CF118]|uniref:hypothetical protein n=1 Tax=Chitinophaga sp. CF118 TaxID=1884367 RepID=UPI0008E009DD|nr:hypothetical protein [Chitinophaga sp. CF118]SFE79041.1 hypothetical protein SAMN05518672_11096 [Chitinophaga sp. CF118]
MEKISALIDKLQELKNSNAGLQSISYYVQLLQAEILHARNRQKKGEQVQRESSHVAVIMPNTALNEQAPATINGYTATYNQTTVAEKPVVTPSVTVFPTPEEVKPLMKEQQPVATEVTPSITEQLPVTPVVTQPAPAEVVPQPLSQRPVAVPAPPPAPIPAEPVEKKHAPAMITLFPNMENPLPPSNHKKSETNGLHKELKELNQRIAQNTTSLNERFRQGQAELADKLGEMPVKDLRHAIGINDKFQFIQELFRGDVDTYERSIKTINEFHSLQEAEYWIERELKIRQGWGDEHHLVRQFYSIVRKRFT